MTARCVKQGCVLKGTNHYNTSTAWLDKAAQPLSTIVTKFLKDVVSSRSNKCVWCISFLIKHLQRQCFDVDWSCTSTADKASNAWSIQCLLSLELPKYIGRSSVIHHVKSFLRIEVGTGVKCMMEFIKTKVMGSGKKWIRTEQEQDVTPLCRWTDCKARLKDLII